MPEFVIQEAKITEYLLDLLHDVGGSEARFFLARGFRLDAWENFAAAIKELGLANPIAYRSETSHGIKYVVDGKLRTPSGEEPMVRTVWIVDVGHSIPRLVTAFPFKGIKT